MTLEVGEHQKFTDGERNYYRVDFTKLSINNQRSYPVLRLEVDSPPERRFRASWGVRFEDRLILNYLIQAYWRLKRYALPIGKRHKLEDIITEGDRTLEPIRVRYYREPGEPYRDSVHIKAPMAEVLFLADERMIPRDYQSLEVLSPLAIFRLGPQPGRGQVLEMESPYNLVPSLTNLRTLTSPVDIFYPMNAGRAGPIVVGESHLTPEESQALGSELYRRLRRFPLLPRVGD